MLAAAALHHHLWKHFSVSGLVNMQISSAK